MIKKVVTANIEESEGEGEKGEAPEQRVTGGRRLRRVAARKTAIAESDDEDQDGYGGGKAIDNEGDDEEFDGAEN